MKTKGGVMTRGHQVVFFTACVAATLAWSPIASAGQKYYVSPTGNDNADGTTKKKASRTQDAAQQWKQTKGTGPVVGKSLSASLLAAKVPSFAHHSLKSPFCSSVSIT